ncbi:MAG: DUF4956 domain-containing protein [Ardenticatenaceae bacterium]|nr:DUF4956 domain-containing protein [Ardenticatenaceae bacterium]
MNDLLDLTGATPLPLDTLVVNLLLCIALNTLLAWFYTRYGRSFSNRSKFASNLPILSLVILLVISVVKSSLALSLGLVGALSIVRFRTAIKEPEELVYLFLAIALGLGLGADQRLPTLVAFAVILAYLFLRTTFTPRPTQNNLFFNLTAPDNEATFTQLNQVLIKHVKTADLRRLDHSNNFLQAGYLIHCPDDDTLSRLMDDLKAQFPGAEFGFVQQDNSLGV